MIGELKNQVFEEELLNALYLATKVSTSSTVDSSHVLLGILGVAETPAARAMNMLEIRPTVTPNAFSDKPSRYSESFRRALHESRKKSLPETRGDQTIERISSEKLTLEIFRIEPELFPYSQDSLSSFSSLCQEILVNDPYANQAQRPFLDSTSSYMALTDIAEIMSDEIQSLSESLCLQCTSNSDYILRGKRLRDIIESLRESVENFLSTLQEQVRVKRKPVTESTVEELLIRLRMAPQILFYLLDPLLVDVPNELRILASEIQKKSLLAYDLLRYYQKQRRLFSPKHYGF